MAQTQELPHQPLAEYDFRNGHFSLVFLQAMGDTAFMVKDNAILDQLKENWSFEEEAVTYPFSCNDGYEVILMEAGIPVDQFSIRLRCQAFISNQGWWHFIGLSLGLLPKTSILVKRDTLFSALHEARSFLSELRQREDVLIHESPPWEQFEGHFFFRYPNPNHSGKAPSVDWDAFYREVEQKIQKAYPEEPYVLRLASYGHGKHYPNVTFKLISHRQFFNQFTLFPDTGNGWVPSRLHLVYYVAP